MERIWQNLFAPEAKICGSWLTRYTLWHHALLQAFRSPVFDREPRITASDVLAAVAICRTSYPHRPRFARRTWWRVLLRRRDRLQLQANWLLEWLAGHLAGPTFWREKGKKGPDLTAPDVFLLVYGLTAKAGLTQTEAWNTSPGVAETILGTVAELEGAELSFCDQDDLRDERQPIQPSTRDEVYKRALRDLGPKGADAFIRKWEENNRN